jgi:hypothetical protein
MTCRNLDRPATGGLRLQKLGNIGEFVPNCGSIDPAEWAADIEPALALEHLDAAAADRGVHVLVHPRPSLRQINALAG